MSEWIDVKERLPSEGDLVVAAYLYGSSIQPDACVFYFHDGNFHHYDDGLDASNQYCSATINMTFEPTHWVLLPE